LDSMSASAGTQALQIAEYTKVMSEGKAAQEIFYNNSNLVNKEKNNVMGQNTSTIKNNNKAVDENRNYLSGSKNLQLNQPKNPKYQKVRNNMMIIENIEFSGHALDRMQDRGIPISVVKETIEYGTKLNATGDRTKFYDAKNNISVILENSNGRVITVEYGK
ncbi:MAG: DUF4258 domain-containing protein, partial [Fusobacterium necrophorum]|nr:DUF4258 domain-containing protein [Fusobacterium necrophorum]